MYYILEKSVDPKIVGVNHGAGQLNGSEHFDQLNKWNDDIEKMVKQNKEGWKVWTKHERYAPYPYQGLLLEKKAKQTDFIGTNDLRGFYVNTRLKQILEKGHLPNHNFLPTPLIAESTGKLIEGYWRFVYDVETGENSVDFSRSKFELDKHEQKFGKRFSINSYEDYLNVFYETGQAVRATKLVFNSNFDKQLDIFGTQFLASSRPYLSDRMLKMWKEANISGFVARSPEEAKERAQRFGNTYCELVFQ